MNNPYHQVAFPRTLATVFTNKICRNSVPSLLHSDHFTSKVVCNHDHKLASTYHLNVYSGKFEKLKRSKTYVVTYWKLNETYDNADDFELTKYELGADNVCVCGGGGGDLVYCRDEFLCNVVYQHC